MAFFCHSIHDLSGCSLLFCFRSRILNGMYPRIFSKAFTWAKTHGHFSIEFMEWAEHIWVVIRCWDNSQFRWGCVSILDRFSSNIKEEVFVLGRTIDALGPNANVVSVQCGPHALVEAYVTFVGSGYQQKLIGRPLFDFHLLRQCLQRTASSVFGPLDPYFMTEVIVNNLKAAESRNWMASRPALRKAIISSSLVMHELVDVLAIFVGVWPLIVSYLKETRRKDDGDSLV